MNDFASVQRIYETVHALPPGQRQNRLDELCGEDAALRREILSLLEVNSQEGALLEKTFLETTSLAGRSLGRFQVLKELGSGGMGRVYLAQETAPVRRLVAIKFVPFWGLNEEGRQRFTLEQAILARMNHSYIAKLHESSSTDDGQPYFVMEYLEGEPITHYCDRYQLNIEQRIALFSMVCLGVAHAHLKGVIHRDIKPSNILIVEEDGKPIPKIIDFGIAKPSEGVGLTRAGYAPGTYRYMSPEQASAIGDRGTDIDVRSDVYSLGVLLYELLVGEPPLYWPLGEVPEKIRADIRQKMPQSPSALWRELPGAEGERRAVKRGSSIQKIARGLRGDLDWVLMTALAKDPSRRYRSPEDLVQEFRRWRTHQPVKAGPPSVSYLLGKFFLRHWGVVTLTLTGLAIALGFALYVLQQKKVIASERDTARMEAETSRQVTDFLVEMIGTADPLKEAGRGPNPISVADVMDKARDDLGEAFLDRPTIRARLLDTLGRTYRNRGQLEEAVELYTEALAIQRQVGGEEDLCVVALTHDLGWTYLMKGDLKRAQTLLQGSVEARLRLSGPNDETAALYMNTLVELYLEKGEHQEAKPLLERALAISISQHGRLHENIARSYNSLGMINKKLGFFDQAINNYRQALEIIGELFGDTFPQRSDVLHNFARVYMEKDDFDSAEELLQQALSLDRRIFGDQHPTVASDLQSLALLSSYRGDLAKAETLYRQVIARIRNHLGNGHPNLATALQDIGKVLRDSANPAEGVTMLRESTAIREMVYGHGHPSHVRALIYLSEMLFDCGEYAEMVALLEEALIRGGAVLDEPNAEYYLVLSLKGRGLVGLGHFTEAEDLLLKAYTGIVNSEKRTCYFEARTLQPIIALYEAWPRPGKLAHYSSL